MALSRKGSDGPTLKADKSYHHRVMVPFLNSPLVTLQNCSLPEQVLHPAEGSRREITGTVLDSDSDHCSAISPEGRARSKQQFLMSAKLRELMLKACLFRSKDRRPGTGPVIKENSSSQNNKAVSTQESDVDLFASSQCILAR